MTDRIAHGPVAADQLPPDDERKSPAALMRTLDEDVRQIRVGNGAPESVPVFRPGDDPSLRFVRFADLSANVRHILDVCGEVDVHVDGRRRDGARNWREFAGRRGPVLEWHTTDKKA